LLEGFMLFIIYFCYCWSMSFVSSKVCLKFHFQSMQNAMRCLRLLIWNTNCN